MKNTIGRKANELRRALRDLGRRLQDRDESELLVWVIPDALACAHRPLRHHPKFGGSGRDLPVAATAEVFHWADRISDSGIRAIISLMHPKELLHYAGLDLGAEDLTDFYRRSGFEVRHIPWEDPAHQATSERSFRDELVRVRQAALDAFDELPKPILLHCSAGIDRSSPVAAYIWSERAQLKHSDTLVT